MNEQLMEQSEEVLMIEVSDEALEAAAGNKLGGPGWPDNGGSLSGIAPCCR